MEIDSTLGLYYTLITSGAVCRLSWIIQDEAILQNQHYWQPELFLLRELFPARGLSGSLLYSTTLARDDAGLQPDDAGSGCQRFI